MINERKTFFKEKNVCNITRWLVRHLTIVATTIHCEGKKEIQLTLFALRVKAKQLSTVFEQRYVVRVNL